MSKLPAAVSGSHLRRALERAGFVMTRQRGSHMIMRHSSTQVRVVVPNHRTVKPGTLRHILNQAGITVEELLRLL